MEHYRKIRTQPIGKAIRYYLAFVLLAALVVGIAALPTVSGTVTDTRNVVQDHVPDGATFQIADGRFTTSVPTPFGIGDEAFRVVVDTDVTAAGGPGDSLGSETGIVIGDDVVFLMQGGVDPDPVLLSSAPEISANKEIILSWLDEYGMSITWIVVVMFMIVFVLYHFSAVAAFIFLGAAVLNLLARMMRLQVGFKRWFVVALHAATLPIIADTIFGVFLARIPFMFAFLYSLVLMSVVVDERANPVGKQGSGKQ